MNKIMKRVKNKIKAKRENLFEISTHNWIWVNRFKKEGIREITIQEKGILEFDGNFFYYVIKTFDDKENKEVEKKIKIEDGYLNFAVPYVETENERMKMEYENTINNIFSNVDIYFCKEENEIKVDKIYIPKEVKAINFKNFELTIFSNDIYKIKFIPKYDLTENDIKKFQKFIIYIIEKKSLDGFYFPKN